MLRKSKPARGRPRMRVTTTTFGMKLTPKERNTIKRHAARQGKSASRYILDLVRNDSGTFKTPKHTPTAVELLQLPASERRRILREQAKIAAPYYRNDPDLNFEIHDDILDF